VQDAYELHKTLSACCFVVDEVRVQPRTDKPLHQQLFCAEGGELYYSTERNCLLWEAEENGGRSLLIQYIEMKIVLVLC